MHEVSEKRRYLGMSKSYILLFLSHGSIAFTMSTIMTTFARHMLIWHGTKFVVFLSDKRNALLYSLSVHAVDLCVIHNGE